MNGLMQHNVSRREFLLWIGLSAPLPLLAGCVCTAPPTPAPAPPPPSCNGVTDAQKQEMVDAHNSWRAQVNVPAIAWSDTLAADAQSWADSLAAAGGNLAHSNTSYGENLYGSTGAPCSATAATDAWGSEKSLYTGQVIDNQNYQTFGHYTQMVWSNTTEVGCGAAKAANGAIVWVCQYSPAGNVIGQKPY